jgi:hypothetical protein
MIDSFPILLQTHVTDIYTQEHGKGQRKTASHTITEGGWGRGREVASQKIDL